MKDKIETITNERRKQKKKKILAGATRQKRFFVASEIQVTDTILGRKKAQKANK